jgi:hypothetical protein
MSDDLIPKMNFLKRMRRYGSWSYSLTQTDTITDYISATKTEYGTMVKVYVDHLRTIETFAKHEDAWTFVWTEILKYRESHKEEPVP